MKLGDDIIKEIIRSYTKESGVRNLEREISKLSRKLITEILLNNKKKINGRANHLSDQKSNENHPTIIE